MWTCNRLDLRALGSQPMMMPRNLSDHWTRQVIDAHIGSAVAAHSLASLLQTGGCCTLTGAHGKTFGTNLQGCPFNTPEQFVYYPKRGAHLEDLVRTRHIYLKVTNVSRKLNVFILGSASISPHNFRMNVRNISQNIVNPTSHCYRSE